MQNLDRLACVTGSLVEYVTAKMPPPPPTHSEKVSDLCKHEKFTFGCFACRLIDRELDRQTVMLDMREPLDLLAKHLYM
jgi:hypothetical protein